MPLHIIFLLSGFPAAKIGKNRLFLTFSVVPPLKYLDHHDTHMKPVVTRVSGLGSRTKSFGPVQLFVVLNEGPMRPQYSIVPHLCWNMNIASFDLRPSAQMQRCSVQNVTVSEMEFHWDSVVPSVRRNFCWAFPFQIYQCLLTKLPWMQLLCNQCSQRFSQVREKGNTPSPSKYQQRSVRTISKSFRGQNYFVLVTSLEIFSQEYGKSLSLKYKYRNGDIFLWRLPHGIRLREMCT